MNVILFDHPLIRKSLMPFTLTRPVAKIRIGIFTIDEKWEKYLGQKPSFQTATYLSEKYPVDISEENLWINGALCPDPLLVDVVCRLKPGQVLVKNNVILAMRAYDAKGEVNITELAKNAIANIDYNEEITLLANNWDIFSYNGHEIRKDFDLARRTCLADGRAISDPHTRVYAPENIIIETGASIKAAVLNAETGPIYIGKNTEVQEGAVIRGGFALCEGSTVNMGSKIRGDVTIGPYSKVGGEVSNSIIFGYSNKGHDGFLGNSVIGEWCNLGADTNTSNLKNNYSSVKVWSYLANNYVDTGKMFCGLVMGDHSKCGINTMFNTGTVVGVNANVFGGGFPPKFIPSFAWGGEDENSRFDFTKAMQVADKVMERRNQRLLPIDRKILEYIFDHSYV